jgi:hypothetical protein
MSFELENYSILLSLNERSIYIKVIDKITFMCYENNIDSKELRLSIDLGCAYKMMTKCFLKNQDHNITINVSSGTMKILFNAIVGGYMEMKFEILLREKVMSNDNQLTMNFHRIEQTQLQAMQMLTQRLSQLEELVEAVSYAEIYMLTTPHTSTHNTNKLYWKINTKELGLSSNYWDYTKIKLFYQLEKLTFTSCTDIGVSFKTQNISNKTLKELTLSNISSGMNSLIGLDGFPNLERLTIITCPSIRDIVATLTSYNHNITFIKIQNCTGINNTELMTYCQKNNITLELA